MPDTTNKVLQFWQEARRRKVLPFLIGYLAACFAIIEFFDITSNRFTIPENTFILLYILAAIGTPVVIVLPWIINRKQQTTAYDALLENETTRKIEDKKQKHNLPAQLTTFIGRTREMETISQLIGEHRLVTLTGAGGIGKTRLACEAAAKVIRDYKDGAWLVDLAPISSNELVAREITEVLNIPEVANKAIVDTLVSNIRDMNLLIILDNCEHLIKTCSEIAGKLLQSVPGLHILATSREALNVTGEKVWRVPSLTLLDPKTILDVEYAKSSEAVLMFIDRARLNNPEFELQTENVNEVATICHKLDGIPLAIELVASRTRYMNTEMILDRFSDRFDSLSSSDPGISKRQQTLQSTIEWSYNLLTEDEKALFSRLSVFSGGFDLSAVEEVCSDDQLQKEDILELLSRLVDRSMVYTVKDPDLSMRYTLLETLRQFAQQVLQTSDGETDIRNRHLQYYLKLAEESYAERMEFQHKWMKKLEAEHDNMIASLNWSEVHAVDQFVRLSAALAWYWSSHSYFSLGMDYLERALSMDVKESEAYAHALYGLGMFLWFTGDFKEAEKRYGLNVKNGLKYKNEVLASIDLQGIAFAVGGQKRWAKAIRLNAAARENARALGAALPDSVYFWREWLDTYIGGARQELGQDLTSKYEEEGIAMGFDKAVEYALNFDQN